MDPHAQAPGESLKRKRSPSQSHETMSPAAPLPKAAKTHNHHLQINYLARHHDDGKDLPLVTDNASLAEILSLLGEYQGVLDRNESMAGNLGAKPLGPILMKRFEKMFDAPPRVLNSHGKDTNVTWLDVVEFARTKPEQFTLGQKSEGRPVCQFYTKQCRVQISEEDFVLIDSGIPQKMIPPQPIPEDEDKELATIKILEERLSGVCKQADRVAELTRQLNHRLKNRYLAIIDCRVNASPAPPLRASSPSNVALMNGSPLPPAAPGVPNMVPPTPAGGFVAVNSQRHHELSNPASTATRQELLSKFQTVNERRPPAQQVHYGDNRRQSVGQNSLHAVSALPPTISPNPADSNGPRTAHYSDTELPPLTSAVPIPVTPSSLLGTNSHRSSLSQDKDDGGPFKAEMVRKMEQLSKNERVIPPCDRCRRLHMDCLKNLTACVGCTKKHAKCSWKEVREEELRNGDVENPDGPSPRTLSPDSHVRSASPRQLGASLPPPGPAPTPTPHPFPLDERIPIHAREPPPGIDRDRDRGMEAQLQETARSGLAHAHAHQRLAVNDSKPADYQGLTA